MSIVIGTDGYCAEADVQGLHQQRTFSATSRPTLTQVAGFITDGFRLINGVLDSAGYTIPVGAAYTVSIGILKTVNLAYAAAQVALAAFSAGEGTRQEFADAQMKFFKDQLGMISKGILSLPDALSSTGVINTQRNRGPEAAFNLDALGAESDPIFTRTMDF